MHQPYLVGRPDKWKREPSQCLAGWPSAALELSRDRYKRRRPNPNNHIKNTAPRPPLGKKQARTTLPRENVTRWFSVSCVFSFPSLSFGRHFFRGKRSGRIYVLSHLYVSKQPLWMRIFQAGGVFLWLRTWFCFSSQLHLYNSFFNGCQPRVQK